MRGLTWPQPGEFIREFYSHVQRGRQIRRKDTFLKCGLKAFFFNFLINHLVCILKNAVQNGFIMGINAVINLRTAFLWYFAPLAVFSVSRGSQQKSSRTKLRELSLYPRLSRWTTSNAGSTVVLECKWLHVCDSCSLLPIRYASCARGVIFAELLVMMFRRMASGSVSFVSARFALAGTHAGAHEHSALSLQPLTHSHLCDIPPSSSLTLAISLCLCSFH